jgi:hypothetical protein
MSPLEHIFFSHYNVEYLLKARTVEPEKQPLLANGSETTFISSHRLDKHVPAAKDMHTTIQVPLETVLSTRSVLNGYKDDKWETGPVLYGKEEAVRQPPFREDLSV